MSRKIPSLIFASCLAGTLALAQAAAAADAVGATKPAGDAKPAAAKPADAKPAAAKPADAKPAEAKPSLSDSPYANGPPPITGGYTDTSQGGTKGSGDQQALPPPNAGH